MEPAPARPDLVTESEECDERFHRADGEEQRINEHVEILQRKHSWLRRPDYSDRFSAFLNNSRSSEVCGCHHLFIERRRLVPNKVASSPVCPQAAH